jgi:hypothetical protein
MRRTSKTRAIAWSRIKSASSQYAWLAWAIDDVRPAP